MEDGAVDDRFDKSAIDEEQERREEGSKDVEQERGAGRPTPGSGDDGGAQEGPAQGGEAQDGPARDGETQEGSAPLPEFDETVWREQVSELQNRLLRAQADFDNYRKRTRQEKDELVSIANAKLIAELLPVLDHFALALQAADAAADSAALAKGIDMVYRQLLDVLDKAGVKSLDPEGEVFDPKRHEAVLSEAVEGAAPGVVVQVLRSGYTLHDRVLRPAMVKISQ